LRLEVVPPADLLRSATTIAAQLVRRGRDRPGRPRLAGQPACPVG
jgi:hypothetical protein